MVLQDEQHVVADAPAVDERPRSPINVRVEAVATDVETPKPEARQLPDDLGRRRFAVRVDLDLLDILLFGGDGEEVDDLRIVERFAASAEAERPNARVVQAAWQEGELGRGEKRRPFAHGGLKAILGAVDAFAPATGGRGDVQEHRAALGTAQRRSASISRPALASYKYRSPMDSAWAAMQRNRVSSRRAAATAHASIPASSDSTSTPFQPCRMISRVVGRSVAITGRPQAKYSNSFTGDEKQARNSLAG